ncbi:MAG: pyrroline-5-carboxylate reductase [Christensenellales bacterium]|jgi:pyrroline-5-carboxylate reductase
MKEYNLGFIGAGNMAQAIINGAIEKRIVAAGNIYVYDIDTVKINVLENSLGVNSVCSINELSVQCDFILIAVKPNIMPDVLNQIKEFNKPVISIAAGWSADMIKNVIGCNKKVLRLMPNTPLMVGEGMSVFETPNNFDEQERIFIERIFSSLGKVDCAPLKLMDAVTAVSGSGPAYVYMFIESLADAGVLCGLPRSQAITLATQTVLGAAKTVMDTGKHPGALKDAVCSPGGTTIEAVKSLEQSGFRGAVIRAVEQCANKSKALND